MKGLLLKDYYMVTRYCRAFLLIVAVFLAVSCFGSDSTFFMVYPTIISGMIPVTLISYDEREKWNVYSAALPYTKAQLVSCKYIVGLIFQLGVFIVTAGVQAYRMSAAGEFTFEGYLSLLSVIFAAGLLGPCLLLPFIFRFGAEKGRIAYYIVIGAICAVSTLFSGTGFTLAEIPNAGSIAVIIAAAAVLLYAISWRISIIDYRL